MLADCCCFLVLGCFWSTAAGWRLGWKWHVMLFRSLKKQKQVVERLDCATVHLLQKRMNVQSPISWVHQLWHHSCSAECNSAGCCWTEGSWNFPKCIKMNTLLLVSSFIVVSSPKCFQNVFFKYIFKWNSIKCWLFWSKKENCEIFGLIERSFELAGNMMDFCPVFLEGVTL